jgi:glycosyltransferase involved in cell wall biosynthesis
MMPLRIAFDARHVRDFGFGTYIRNLLHALAAIGAPHRFFLISRQEDRHEFDGLPDNFERVFYEKRDTDRDNQIAFPWLVRRLNVDLSHIPLVQVPFLMPRPYVVTVHDLSALVFEARAGWRHEVRLMKLRRAFERAARVIAVSDSTMHDVVNIVGVPARKVVRIYGAPDPRFSHHLPGGDARAAGPEAWEKEQRRILERYQVNYPFLLYAGTIRPQKNIPRLIEAFALVKRELAGDPKYADLRLIIIGDEISRYPLVRQTVLHSRIDGAVRFLGFVSLNALRVFFGAAEAFVFPSLYEGFGLPPLESMASGTAVVCSKSTSLAEVVGDAAMIVSPDNVFDIARGIREVLTSPELRAQMIVRGYAQVARFTWEETARQVNAVYEASSGGGTR